MGYCEVNAGGNHVYWCKFNECRDRELARVEV